MRVRYALAGVALILGAAACSSVQTLSYPDPPTTLAPAPTGPTLPSNLSSVHEGPVPGSATTTTIGVGSGAATLNGTVFGPDGPVSGATVEVDRIVGDEVASTKATTAADGSWRVAAIEGGTYRVRAWQSPSLTMATPQLFFLAGTQTLSMSLQLAEFRGPHLEVTNSPSHPVAGRPVNLLVQVTNPVVGADGVLTYPPDAGASVTLTDGPGWTVNNANPVTTDAEGDSLFSLTCSSAGANPLSAEVGSNPPVALQMPDCSPPPTTTVPATTSTTCPPQSSITTFPPAGQTTTSTRQVQC